MSRCPKCSGWMNGPRYRRLGWGGEVLVYNCDCGYSEQRPTHDATDEPNPFAGRPDRLHPRS